MQLPKTFEELVVKSHDLKLYKKLVLQLNKDLSLANIDLEFDEEVLPTSLKLVLQEELYNLIQDKFSEYLNLLYIVDVPEVKVKALDGNDVVKLSDDICFLVLQREWQKVFYKAKKKYS